MIPISEFSPIRRRNLNLLKLKDVDVNKEILRLAVPNIISNLSIPILSTVDTALMGHLSAVHLGAVGIGSMIFNFIYWNFGFLRMGTTGMTAQAFGEGDHHMISLHLWRSVMVALTIAAVVMVLYIPIRSLISVLFDLDQQQHQLVIDYFKIRIIAAPATLLLYVFMGWYFGIQNAVIPLVITVIINVLNAALSYVLVVIYQLDIYGVAVGTVVSQYVGLISILILYFNRRGVEFRQLNLKELWHLRGGLRSYLSTNTDLFIRTLCLTSSFGFFYIQSSSNGPQFLGASVILLQLINWMSYGVDGFAHAAESIVGKYAGAKQVAKASEAIRKSFLWGLALAVLYALIFYIFSESIISLFTNDAQLILITQGLYVWIIIFPIISFSSYIWDGIFIGLLASREMRNSMLFSVLLFMGAYYIMFHFKVNSALWISFILFMGSRGLIQTLYYFDRLQFDEEHAQ